LVKSLRVNFRPGEYVAKPKVKGTDGDFISCGSYELI